MNFNEKEKLDSFSAVANLEAASVTCSLRSLVAVP